MHGAHAHAERAIEGVPTGFAIADIDVESNTVAKVTDEIVSHLQHAGLEIARRRTDAGIPGDIDRQACAGTICDQFGTAGARSAAARGSSAGSRQHGDFRCMRGRQLKVTRIEHIEGCTDRQRGWSINQDRGR